MKQGNITVLVLWIIFFWPIAIWYWFNRVWAKETFTKNIKTQNEIDAEAFEKQIKVEKKETK